MDDHGNTERREVVSVSEVVRERSKGKHHAGEECNGRFNDHWGHASGMDNRIHKSCNSGDEAGKVDDDYGDQKPVQLSYDLSPLSDDASEEGTRGVSGVCGLLQGWQRRGSQRTGRKLGEALILKHEGSREHAFRGFRGRGKPETGAGAFFRERKVC